MPINNYNFNTGSNPNVTSIRENTSELDARIVKAMDRNKRFGKVTGFLIKAMIILSFPLFFYLLIVGEALGAAVLGAFLLFWCFVFFFAKGVAERMSDSDLIKISVKQVKNNMK